MKKVQLFKFFAESLKAKEIEAGKEKNNAMDMRKHLVDNIFQFFNSVVVSRSKS